MKKLKVVLTLLFAMCCSLFLFACGEDRDYTAVTVTGAKTAYTDSDTTVNLDGLTVTVTMKSDGKQKTLKADEYTVDTTELQAALTSKTTGTYTVTVTPNGQAEGSVRTGTYTATISHAWGAADADGWQHCDCGAEQLVSTVNDEIHFGAWNTLATLNKKGEGTKSTATIPEGEQYVRYGSIGIGQEITLKATVTPDDDSAVWLIPLIGIKNGKDGLLTQSGAHTMNGPGTVADGTDVFAWPNHTGGGISAGTAADVKTGNDWDAMMEGSGYFTADFMPSATATISWNYREDGIVSFTVTRDLTGATRTTYVKAPSAVYECVLYGEKVKVEVSELNVVNNLVLQNYEVLTQPTQKVYAENTMFNLAGVTTKATYNKSITANVTTFDLLADTGTGNDVVVHNLRKEVLTDGMTNFRVAFGGKSVAIEGITVTPSVITGTDTDGVIVRVGADAKVDFPSVGIEAVYGITDIADAATAGLTVVLTGAPKKTSDDQKTALSNATDYISFTLPTKVAATSASVTGGVAQVREAGGDKYVDVVLAITAEMTNPTLTVTVDQTQYSVLLDVAQVKNKISNYAAFITDNTTTLDGTGDVKVDFTGLGDVTGKQLSLWVGNFTGALKTDGSKIDLGSVKATATEVTEGKTTVTFELPAIDPQQIFNSYDVSLAIDGTIVATETVYYNYEFSENGANGFVNLNGMCVKVSGTDIYFVSAMGFEGYDDYENLQIADDGNDFDSAEYPLYLNIQNDKGNSYPLSFNLKPDGTVELTQTNTICNNTTATFKIDGTINNSADVDRGMIMVFKGDLSKVGARTDLTSKFAFAVYDNNISDTTFDIFVVGDGTAENANKIEKKTLTLATDCQQVAVQEPDCGHDGVQAYKYVDGEFTFLFGQVSDPAQAATGNHTWGTGETANECTVCHATKQTIGGLTVVTAPDDTKTAIDNTDPSATWWDGAVVIKQGINASQNFAFTIDYTLTDDWCDVWLEFFDVSQDEANTGRFFGINAFCMNAHNGGTAICSWAPLTQTVTYDGETKDADWVRTALHWGDGDFETLGSLNFNNANVQITIAKSGTNLVVFQKAVLESGKVFTMQNVYTDWKSTGDNVTFQLNGNPIFASDITFRTGTVVE